MKVTLQSHLNYVVVMDEVAKLAYDSVYKYFNALKCLGQYDDVSTAKLIIVLFIERMVNELFLGMFDEDDYKSIMTALANIEGSTCIVGFPDYATYDSMVHEINNDYLERVKVTEEGIPRMGQLGGFLYHEHDTEEAEPPHIPAYDKFSEALDKIE